MRISPLRADRGQFPPLDGITQYPFDPGYLVFTLPTAKRLRVDVADTVIADTVRALILFETGHLPIYYFPLADIRMSLMRESNRTTFCPYKGTASHFNLVLGERRVEHILWQHVERVPGCPPITEHAAFHWDKIDHWFEEEVEVFGHARDPFRRVDCLRSHRRVEIYLDGQRIADTSRAVFLFETGLPPRHYLPVEDVAPGILVPSERRSLCPYKGQARYHHLHLGDARYDDVAWSYDAPMDEALAIKGLVAFYPERLARILIDGVEQDRG